MKNLLLFFLNLLDSRKKFNFFTKILQFKHESITKRNKNQKEGGGLQFCLIFNLTCKRRICSNK